MAYDEDFGGTVSDEDIAARRAKACAERGVRIVEPGDNELFIDIDTHESLGIFHANVRALGKLVKSSSMHSSPSRKAGRYHIRVKLTRAVKDAFERIMLQALLGSDLNREIISWRDANGGATKPTVFFERELSKVLEE